MPSHSTRLTQAPARSGAATVPGSGADHADWSMQLARSPAQLRQAAQLRHLFGPRAETAPATGVVQGQFQGPDSELVDTADAARALAARVAAVYQNQQGMHAGDEQYAQFEAALVHLAVDGDDHRELDMPYLLDLLERGQVQEQFVIEQSGRRLHTRLAHQQPNFPPTRSQTASKLTEVATRPTRKKRKKGEENNGDSDSEGETSKGDLTYRDLRAILNNAHIEQLPPDLVQQATQHAVNDWRENTLGVNPDFPVDVQLVAQHLLHYQHFNTPMLKGRYKIPGNEPLEQRNARMTENRSRQHELEKSKRMLVTDSRNQFLLTMPPDPQGHRVAHAFSGLPDMNRPLPDSPLQGAAYKAVYLCTKLVLRRAWDHALARAPNSENADLDHQQRLSFNRALLELMPGFEQSTVNSQEESQNYIRNTIGLSRFSAQEALSEEDSASSEEEAPMPDQMSRAILDESRPVEENAPKIKTWSATIGTLNKLSLQKRLIDEATLAEENKPAARQKHARRARKIERHVGRVSARHNQHFKTARSELNYLTTKRNMLAVKLAEIEADLELAQQSANEARVQVLERRKARLLLLTQRFETFYAETSVQELSIKPPYWKRSHRHLKLLGKAGLQAHLTQGEPEEENDADDERDIESERQPRKKKKRESKKKGNQF